MNKKLHILFLSSWYPSRVSPNNGNFVKNHAQAVATKHKVTVVYPIGDSNCNAKIEIERTEINNIDTIIVYFKKHRFFLINAIRKFNALKTGLKLIEAFDIIHGNVLNPIGLFAWLISVLKKKPYIFTEHWTGYLPESKTHQNLISFFLQKFVAKKGTFICPVSNQLKQAMQSCKISGNYSVVGNVVNTDLFYPKTSNNPKFIITHISSFRDKHKNLSGILRTIKKISVKRQDFIFKIVGDGNLAELNKKIEKFNFQKGIIEVEGSKTSKEIAHILQSSNLYISFSNYETFGIVMLEAIACGVPVISTNTGIINELMLTDYAKIVPINNEKELNSAICFYMNSDCRLNKTEMHSFVKSRFSLKPICDSFSRLYYNTLKV